MAYKLQVNEPKQNLKFNVRYENLAKFKRPPIEAKAPNGKIVKERTTFNGQVLKPGMTQRQWVDDDGQVYGKTELTFYYEGEAVPEISQTKVFNIEGFQPLVNYTDKYVIDKYYELFPDDDGHKKDRDKEIAIASNRSGMYKLWEYLQENQLVARGEFCPSSKGFVVSDGYIRAIKVNGNKWGLEIGVFKQEKIFQHLQEGKPKAAPKKEAVATKRLKMV